MLVFSIVAVAAAVALAACGHGHAHAPHRAPDPPVGANTPLDAIVRDLVATEPLAGVQVVVIQHGRVTLARAYGLASVEEHRPMSLDTTLRIGSVTKTFTAVAVMQLAIAGKLRLDDTVTGYLDLPPADNAITIRELLGHRSGLPNYVDIVAKLDNNFDRSTSQIFDLIADAPLEFAPGTADRYSNSNYYLLGMIVEMLAHEPFDAYLRDHVVGYTAGPHTHLCGPTDGVGYELGSGEDLVAQPQLAMSAGFASGGACSTARELATWFDAFVHGRIVPPATLHDMITIAPLPDGSRGDDGFGVAVYPDVYGHTKIVKSGAIDGFSASASYLPDVDATIVAVANTCCDAVPVLDARLTRALLPNVRPDVAIPAADATALTATRHHGDRTLHGTVHGAHARFHFDDGATWYYRYVGGGTYENELSPTVTLHLEQGAVVVVPPSGEPVRYVE